MSLSQLRSSQASRVRSERVARSSSKAFKPVCSAAKPNAQTEGPMKASTINRRCSFGILSLLPVVLSRRVISVAQIREDHDVTIILIIHLVYAGRYSSPA